MTPWDPLLSRRALLGLLPSAFVAARLWPDLLLAGQTPAEMIPDGAWAPLLKGRPRLLGPKDALAQRLSAQPNLLSAIQQDGGILAVGIEEAAKGASPARIQLHIDEAMKNVARGATNAHQDSWVWMDQCAFTFDYFHSHLSADQRAAIIDFLNKNLDSFTADENAFHNSTPSKMLCYLHVAYATMGENPRAPEFRDHAIKTLYEGKLLPPLRRLGEGGGWTDCGWYSRHAVWHMVQALELARRFESYEGLKKAPRFFYDRMAFELQCAYPGLWIYGSEQYPCEGDGSYVYGGHAEYPRHTRTLLAQIFRGSPSAGYVAAKRRKARTSKPR